MRKYALILRSLEIPLSLTGWALCSLATFNPLMTRNPYNRAHGNDNTHWESIMSNILAAALIGTLILLGEKFFIQIISINYHRKQFNLKIKESKRNVYLLGLLYDASRALFPAYCNEFAEEDYIIGDQLNLALLGGSGKRSKGRSGNATPARLIQDVGRIGDKITSAFGNVAQEVTGKQVFNPNSAHSIVTEALEKRRTSEALARRIWMSFVVEGREALHEDDLLDVLGDNRKEEAEEAFMMLDRDGNGDISLEEMILVVTEMSRDRKSIANSMHDVDQAINVLDRMLMTVVFIAVCFVFVAFLNSNFVTTLATAGTALLSLSFVFSVTCQEVLGSCIFLFVKHPYDIGDRVDLGNDQLVVDHISLLFTVFRRVTGTSVGKSVQIPNNTLNTLWIENVSRSKSMKEQLSIYISFDTSFEDIQLLKQELVAFVTDKDNSRDFERDLDVEVLGTSDMSKLEVRVEVRHKSNWANESVRAARRSKFMCALVQALRRVPINAPGGGSDAVGSAANPSYSVAVSDSFAAEARGAADMARKDAKLANKKTDPVTSPKNPDAPPLGLSIPDSRIIDDLSSRNPLDDPRNDAVEDDSSTLGERPSIDQAIEDVRGLLHRTSTKGKRRPGAERMISPSVPAISEPAPLGMGMSGAQTYGYAQAQQTSPTRSPTRSTNTNAYSIQPQRTQSRRSERSQQQQQQQQQGAGVGSSWTAPFRTTSQKSRNSAKSRKQGQYTAQLATQEEMSSSLYSASSPPQVGAAGVGDEEQGLAADQQVEMRQMNRSPSNPYRLREQEGAGAGVSRKPIRQVPPPQGMHPSQRSDAFGDE